MRPRHRHRHRPCRCPKASGRRRSKWGHILKTMHLFCFGSCFFAWGHWGHWGQNKNSIKINGLRIRICPQCFHSTGDTGDIIWVIHSANEVINLFCSNIVQFSYNRATTCASKTGITFEAVNVRAQGLDSTRTAAPTRTAQTLAQGVGSAGHGQGR